MADFDRPLEQRGISDARAVGDRIVDAGYRPDLVLCSSARRTQETWTCVEPAIGSVPHGVRFMRQLYAADARGYLDLVRTAEAETVLVIGHNPMIEETASLLMGEDDLRRPDGPASGFPTSALAAIRFDGPLDAVRPRAGTLEGFFTRKDD